MKLNHNMGLQVSNGYDEWSDELPESLWVNHLFFLPAAAQAGSSVGYHFMKKSVQSRWRICPSWGGGGNVQAWSTA